MIDNFLGLEFIFVSPDFISTCVVRKLVLLMQIVTIELHRSIQELENFATIIEGLILSLRKSNMYLLLKNRTA